MGAVRPALIPAPRSARRVLAMLAAALAAVALTSCGTTALDHAATVDGQVISQSDLYEATEQLRTVEESALPAELLSVLVRTPALDEAVRGTETGVTNQRILADVQAVGIVDPNPLLVDYLRGRYFEERLGVQLSPEVLAGLDVEVNPRYGVWDPVAGTLTTPTPEWITPHEDDS